MNKIQAYWVYHKSTLLLNLITSVSFSLVWFPYFYRLFPSMIMTTGTLIGLFYKEITQRNEYYFYYNLGISRYSLMAVNASLNIITGIILLWLFSYVQPA